jgi:hypothetical protein
MKSVILLLWGVWDWLYFRCNRMKYVAKEKNIFRIVHKRYRGPVVYTKSGQRLQRGDEIIKLHIYNYGLAKELLKYDSNFSIALYLKKNMGHSLKGLLDYIEQLPEPGNIKAVFGTSMLNRGAERFGFTVLDVEPTFYYKCKSYLYQLIYLIVHPFGMKYVLMNRNRLQSKHLVITIDELRNFFAGRRVIHEKSADLYGKKGG